MKSFKSIINLVKVVATDVAEAAKVLDEKAAAAMNKAAERTHEEKKKETKAEKKARIAAEHKILEDNK